MEFILTHPTVNLCPYPFLNSSLIINGSGTQWEAGYINIQTAYINMQASFMQYSLKCVKSL